MISKFKYILVILIIVILAIVGITIIYKIANDKNKIEENIIKDNSDVMKEITIWDYEDSDSIVGLLAQKNGDWSRLPLTENFRKKYNEKDGLLGDIQFDKVEYKPDIDIDYYKEKAFLLVTQGKKKTIYRFALYAKDGLIDKVNFSEISQLTDERGNILDYRQSIKADNFDVSMMNLAWGYEDEQGVGVTDQFHKKYPHFLDLFIHYSPLEFNKITFLENRSSFDKKEAYFEVDSELECKIRTYKVKFKLDGKGYLDDADVELLSEKKYESDGSDTRNKIFYKNSDWGKLKVTKDFRKKFNSKQGTFPDIDSKYYYHDVKVSFDTSAKKIDENSTIVAYLLNDKHFHYYLRTINKDNDLIDNVIYKNLNIIDMDSNDVKELYLNRIKPE